MLVISLTLFLLGLGALFMLGVASAPINKDKWDED